MWQMNTWNNETKKHENIWFSEDQPCKIAEAIRKQNEGKPPWLRSNSIMISCNCKRCRPIC